MLAIVVMMTLGMLVAAGVAVYVAYPHRGAEMPVAPQLGNAMRKLDLKNREEAIHFAVNHARLCILWRSLRHHDGNLEPAGSRSPTRSSISPGVRGSTAPRGWHRSSGSTKTTPSSS